MKHAVASRRHTAALEFVLHYFIDISHDRRKTNMSLDKKVRMRAMGVSLYNRKTIKILDNLITVLLMMRQLV